MADPQYISQITLPDNETYNVKDSAAARVSHTHGNLTNDGKITSTATIASGDKLVIVDSDSTAGSKITGSSITFGTSTAQWLNNSGKWSTPSAAQVGAATTNHTHTLSLATDTGTSSTTLAHGGKYKLTAGGNSVIFTLPSDNNTTYTISSGANNGQITVTPSSGDAYNVSVTGLGSAAYTSAGAYASSGHTHTTTIADAASGDTNQKTLAFGGKYKLTAGGTNYIFTMPSNPNTNTTYTISSGDSSGEIKVTPSTENAYNVKVKDINAAAYRGVDSSIGASSTSSKLPTSAAVASFVEGKGYVTSSGVTQITAGSGLSGGTITTTGTIGIATSGITNDMIANNTIANGKLANSAISIAGTSVSLGGTLAADTLRTNLGLSNALHFRGIATVEITDGSTTNPTISGYDFSKKEAGDVIIDKDSAYEFIWSGSKWERLGPDGSYKPLQTAVTDTNASTSATTTFVQAVTQDANGVITVTKAPLNTSGTWSGNAATATSATTATNLANKPTIQVSDTTKITITAGGKTSDAFTVPYATTAGAVAWTNVTGKPNNFTPSSHTHGNITNDGKIGTAANYAVYTTTSGTVTAGSLAVSAPTASGTATAFITSVSQDSKGQISASKANIPEAAIGTTGLVNTTAQTFGGTKTFNGGAHFYGSIDASLSFLQSGGAYHGGHNTIILHGDSAGVSGIGFTSQKATDSATITNINSPSDRAFIQYHAYGVTTQTAEGTAPTLATSGEAGRLVIGVGNDPGDKILLQAPSHTDVMHTIGNTNYVIPDTGNQTGSVGGATTPVYVETGIIKAGTALKALAYKDSLTYSDVGAAAASHTHSTQDLVRPSGLRGFGDVTLQTLVSKVRANRLAFLPGDQIIIEKTTDGGTTWTDAGYTDTQKAAIFADAVGGNITLPLLNGVRNILCGIRITITAMKYNVPAGTAETQKYNYWNVDYLKESGYQERYCQLKDFYFYITSSADTMSIKIERSSGAANHTWSVAFDDPNFYMQGWSGVNYVKISQNSFGGGSTQTGNYWNYRFTFMTRGQNGTSTMGGSASQTQAIYQINGYGDNVWANSNQLMKHDHLYSFDQSQNAIFPADIRPQKNNTASLGTSSLKWANVYATTFTGDLTGNATNVTGTVAIANGGTGKTTALDATNALLSGLPTWTADPTDNTVLIRRDTGGSESYGKVTFSTVWNYIKGKTDSTYSASGHTHGNIANNGTITSTGVALANGDQLLFSDSSNSGKIERSSITIGTATTTWLRNDGTWATPPDTNKYHKTGSWSGLTYTATAVNGADALTFTIPTGTTSATVALGNHNHDTAYVAKSAGVTGVTWNSTSKEIRRTINGSIGTVVGFAAGSNITLTAEEDKLTIAGTANNAVTNTLGTTTKFYITGTTTSTTNTGTQYFDTGVYVSATAGELVATKFTGALNGTANVANKLGTADKGSTTKPIYLAAGVATECSTYAGGTAVTLNGADKAASTASFYAPTSAGSNTQALVGGTPTWTSISPSITIGAGTSSAAPTVNVGVLGQSGTAQSITIASTAVYGVTKLQDGVSSDSTVLAATAKAAKTASTSATHTLATTTKFFVTGCTSSTTNTAGDDFDTGVYVTTTAGEISALRHSWHDPSSSPVEKAYSYWNPNNQSIDFVFN